MRRSALTNTGQVVHLEVARLVEERPAPTGVPRLWSTRALAERWNVHRLTIYRAHQSGRLRGYRILGCLRFLEEDVLALLEADGVQVERGGV